MMKQLFEMQDLSYQEFQSKLIPTVASNRIIGVRTPELRRFAKKFVKTEEAESFLQTLPHYYYEENNLHAFMLETIKDYELAVKAVDEFLPYVDNWATCDLMSPKVFAEHRMELLGQAKKWMSSEETYKIRFGIKMLMMYYLDDPFDPYMNDLVAKIETNEYYVKMMIAWYFATALTKQYQATLPYLESKCLEVWIHNKTIQKATESHQIPVKQKAYLKTLKISIPKKRS